MLVLKYSFLDREKQIVKVLAHGRYGVFSLSDNILLTKPVFDRMQYHHIDDTIWAKQNGFYIKVDKFGNRLDESLIPEQSWAFVDKNDRCPSCSSSGCIGCHGFGFIPFNGDFTPYFLID